MQGIVWANAFPQYFRTWSTRFFWGFAPWLVGISACGPKPPKIPSTVEAIARDCYVELITSGITPKLESAKAMEDGTFLILWSTDEQARGSCSVDGRGTVLLVTNNADLQPPSETSSGEPPAE